MMRIDGVGGSMFKSPGSAGQSDPVINDLRKQIADKQKELQELTSNQDMKPEEKMKKSQELQKEIARLNQELRQHQTTRRKEQREDAAAENAGSRDERQSNGYMQVDIRL